MKKTVHFSKIRSNRVKYLKLFPLFIQDIDQVEESVEHWPCYTARLVDDLIIIPDVEQADKLFRYGSFGKCEFSRTTTQTSPSVPLENVPNNHKRYEKPYRLRALEFEGNKEEPMNDFEKAFLQELNEKMFPLSLEQVRHENRRECQQTTTTDLLPPTNVEISPSKSLVYEHVYLLPEETIFLQHALGCLTVKDDSNQFSPDDLWQRFTHQNPSFPIKYAVYYHFRSAGWIVKSGLKFGCDYMLYKFGPTFNHASYCVSIENFWQSNSSTWSFLFGLNRACLNAGKSLLLVRVQLPTTSPNDIGEFLEQTLVQTIEMNRWLPNQQETK